jgi:ElaB/YqjD/DUF883 family membrane-anchored ribosome-binding protein
MSDRDLRMDLDALKDDLARLREDFGELAHTLKDLARSGAGAARERLDQGAHGVVDEIRSLLERMRHTGKDAVESVEERVQKNPLAGVLIALGVGFLLGKLLERR